MTTAMTVNLADLAEASPVGGQVTSGSGSISQAGATTTIAQHSQNLSLNWQGFNVAPKETVNFVQPNAQSIAVNRILSNQGSQILGHINANGQVWLINPNGILFGAGAQVNVGGLVASTLSVSDSELGSPARHFSGNGSGSVVNQGSLTAASGGYIALLGQQVSNAGTIQAPGGTVALGAGTAQTLTFADNTLLALQVDQSTLNNLAGNSGLIQADGGRVILSAGAKDAVLASVVNNTGVIEARTVANTPGSITLLGGMQAGETDVGGTLDASAPQGGAGGFIDTSAAHVKIAPDTQVTTAAAQGQAGNWLIDPQDYTIAASGGDITGAQLGGLLANNNITVVSDQGATAGNGDINVNAAVSWSSVNTLTLDAVRNINFNSGGSITTTAGSLTARADMNGTGSGTINMNGGSVNVSGGGNILFYYNPAVFGTPSTFSNITLTGSGSATNYMLVDTAAELQNISLNPAGNYALADNIDASVIANFTPITTYSGKFDGLNDTVSNLTESYPSTSNVGLFSQLSSSANIRNLNLSNVNINGGTQVGGLVGYDNGATIKNVSVSGAVVGNTGTVGGLIGLADNGTTISYVSSSATVSEPVGSTGSNVGGLVGQISGTGATLANSFATGSVSPPVSVSDVGGLVGNNTASISNSYATGIVNGAGDTTVGGLVGLNAGTIAASYATGAVAGGVGAGTANVGGLVGGNSKAISNSYATGNVTAIGGAVGGFIGTNTGAAISNSYETGNVTLATGGSNVGGFIGNNTSSSAISNSYATGNVTDTPSATIVALRVGGFIGDSLATGGITDSYATGNVSAGGNSIGGFIGMASTTMTNVYASGNVTASVNFSGTAPTGVGGLIGTGSGTTINNSYYSGILSAAAGSTSVGGLTGSGTATINHAFWDVTTSGQATNTIAGAVGMTTANMQTQANYTSATTANGNVNPGWDFTTVWQMGSGSYLYPVFKVAMGPTTTPGVIAAPAAAQSYYPLTLTGLTASNKVYDAGMVASSTASLAGLLSGDTVNLILGSSQFSDKNVGTGKTVTLNGASLSGAAAGKYQLVPAAGMTTTADITPLAITVTATGSDKVYDATVNDIASVASTGVLNGDTVSFSSGGASFADKNVGNDKTVTVTGIAAGGADAANYTVNSSATTTASITPLAIAVTATGTDKVYDATVNDIAILASSGVLAGDSVIFNLAIGGGASFADKNVGSNKTVTVTGISAGGTDAGNYTLLNTSATTTASITPLAITVAAIGADKVYDGTANDAATLASNGILSGDQVNFSEGTSSFADKNAGTNKVVTVGGISADGADASNYSFNSSAVTTASITPLAIAVTATGTDKVYDATVNDIAILASSGVLAGDTVSFNDASASFADKDVGSNKAVTVSGISASGADAGNYSFNSSATTSASITPLAIAVTATGTDRVYDATVNDNAILASSGVLAGDSVIFNDASASFADKNVGAGKAVTVTGISAGGADAGNYSLLNTSAVTTASITPLAISIAATGGSQVYNGTSNATVSLASSGVLAGDNVIFNDTFASLADKNVGSDKTVTVGGIGATGSDAGNYIVLNTTATTTANVTPLAISVAAMGGSQVYNGTSNAVVDLSSNGVLAGDSVIFNDASASFADKNVGSDKTVTVSGINANGSDAGNYTLLNTTATTTASVTPLAIAVAAIGGSQVYNGTSNAVVDLSSSGVLAGDSVIFNDASASFADKNVGSDKLVTVNGISASGTDAGNYTLLNTDATTSSSITPAVLSYVVTPLSLKSGQSLGSLSGTVIGLAPDDTLANATTGVLTWVTSATSFTRPGKYLIVGGGLSAENYVFAQAPGNDQGLIVVAAAGQPLPPATLLPQFHSGLSGADAVFANVPEGTAQEDAGLEDNHLSDAVNHMSLRIIDGGVRRPVED